MAAHREPVAAAQLGTHHDSGVRHGEAHGGRRRPGMDTVRALAMVALGGAIATDVMATFVLEHAARQRDRRPWTTAAGLLAASLALFALALEEIPTAVAEALFVAVGSAAVAVIALRRGESISTRKGMALALLALGVVVLQTGAGDA